MKSTKQFTVDAEAYLTSIGIRANVKTFRRNEIIYSTGDPANHVFLIKEGCVRRTVVSSSGKEAVVGILGRGDFLGTLCLSNHPIRIATMTAIAPTTVLKIRKEDMITALHSSLELSDSFMAYLLARVVKFERGLIEHLFNAADKRLARALIGLARFGKRKNGKMVLPKVSQELLAEMIGVSRQRTNSLMNRFRKLGFINYNGEFTVNSSLSSFVGHSDD